MTNAVKPKKTSVVYFVGAGPGDPELLTVKAMRLLKKADVVVYAGSLVEKSILKFCRKGVKLRDSSRMHLGEITGALVRAASSGKKTVRVHSGDPCLYGALREQTQVLEENGVPYEIVPGVSSAFASAAALKRELTAPMGTQTVIFTRLNGRTPVPESEGLASLAAHRATICVFLSAGMMDKVVAELKKGYAPGTPVAVVYRATWKDQVIIKGVLSDIAGRVKAAGITQHAMIIAGAAIGDAALRDASKLYSKGFTHGCRAAPSATFQRNLFRSIKAVAAKVALGAKKPRGAKRKR
ncbi:MAG: precorrin-4 C(11)-methyltransferase [Deltaproteobacteria bacterium]|nr:precorrin-4 C(11)-methyltransferase [Deltaproteobacteria bacterium]